ncbi:MAG: aminotransferase class IV [Bacteroidales bacterium]|nr:aminotransferase class IV [Bacteroidales bacterium]
MTEPIFVEVLKVKNGTFIDIQDQLERIYRTTLHFFSKPLIVNLTNNIIPIDLRNKLVKCRIVYAKEIISIHFETYKLRNIQSLALVEHNTIEYSYKYKNRDKINELLRQHNECDDILIVKNSLVTDTSYSNVVFKDIDGKLYTPASTLLAGTKRQKLLDTGIIYKKEIRINDIKSYEGVYLINAMIDIEDNVFVNIDNIR